MTIVIPAYKPDEKLIGLIHSLMAATDARLLVVNDGSGEEFEPIFRKVEELECTLLRHPENRGKGAALKTAYRFLLEEGGDEIVCTADADGQHLPKDILHCLEEAKAHPEALVLGSRSFSGDVPARSRFGNAVSRHTFHLLMGTRVYDTQTGLRAFSATLLPEMLAVEGNRYEYEMQVLCNAAKKKTPIREVEIETVYLEENRSSHFNPLKDALRVYGILFRAAFGRAFQVLSFLFSSVAAFVVDVSLYWLLLTFVFDGALASALPDPSHRLFFSLFLARCASSVCNYLINRRVVFHQLKKSGVTFGLYLMLVVAIFFGNHFLNDYLHLTLGLHEVLSLILAQCVCFPVSFLVQKYLIFKK